MRNVALTVLCLLSLLACGCQDRCETLTDETCALHGDESAICLARRAASAENGPERQDVCRRALMLYRSVEGRERSE